MGDTSYVKNVLDMPLYLKKTKIWQSTCNVAGLEPAARAIILLNNFEVRVTHLDIISSRVPSSQGRNLKGRNLKGRIPRIQWFIEVTWDIWFNVKQKFVLFTSWLNFKHYLMYRVHWTGFETKRTRSTVLDIMYTYVYVKLCKCWYIVYIPDASKKRLKVEPFTPVMIVFISV